MLLCEGADWPARLRWRYRAITFGHVVLAVDELDDATFEHELVHVRQYERWGPLLVPLYVAWAFWMWMIGRDPYRDNPFEVTARRARLHRRLHLPITNNNDHRHREGE